MPCITDLDVNVPISNNEKPSIEFEQLWHELKLCLDGIETTLENIQTTLDDFETRITALETP